MIETDDDIVQARLAVVAPLPGVACTHCSRRLLYIYAARVVCLFCQLSPADVEIVLRESAARRMP